MVRTFTDEIRRHQSVDKKKNSYFTAQKASHSPEYGHGYPRTQVSSKTTGKHLTTSSFNTLDVLKSRKQSTFEVHTPKAPAHNNAVSK
jgi:hypothetical protein